jgi:hypothetical protein
MWLLRGHRSTPRMKRRDAMPILECRCGMVMSVPAANPRATCIRCGGIQLGHIESPAVRRDPANNITPTISPPNLSLPLVLQLVGEAAVHVGTGV